MKCRKYQFIFILVLIAFTLNKSIEMFFQNNDNKISIVIPCIPRDIKYLDRLISSIKSQTFKPYEIIISISEISSFELMQIKDKLKEKFYLPIEITGTTEKKYAGGNRNIGAKKASGDIITFMDADDVMHPQKLELVNKYFKIYNPKLFLHGHSYGYSKNFQIIEKNCKIYHGDQLYDFAIRKTNGILLDNNMILNTIESLKKNIKKPLKVGIGGFENENIRPAHGHVSIQKNVFENVKYREDLIRAQDCIYIREIFQFYGRNKDTALFLNIPLSQYVPSKM